MEGKVFFYDRLNCWEAIYVNNYVFLKTKQAEPFERNNLYFIKSLRNPGVPKS